MATPRGIFVNCPPASCSIFESGLMFFAALRTSTRWSLDYVDVRRFEEIPPGYDFYAFNYHHVAMAELDTARVRDLPGFRMTFVLEMLPGDPFVLCPDHFDAYCVPDPTLRCADPRVYAFPRPLERTGELPAAPPGEVPLIGSFGFATPGKGFEDVVRAVNREFDRAVVRLNIPSALHADPTGQKARELALACRSLAKPGIEVVADHAYLAKAELIAWCAANTLNVFLYDRRQPGLSATTDQAIVSGRPLAVSTCETFRHIHAYLQPYPGMTLREAIERTPAAVARMRSDWSPERFAQRFAEVLGKHGGLLPGAAPACATGAVTLPAAAARRPPRAVPRVLYVSHRETNCGIHEFGLGVHAVLARSRRYAVEYAECGSAAEYVLAMERTRPDAVIYNHYPLTMPWLSSTLIHGFAAVHVGTLHEVTQHEADHVGRDLFDAHLAPDPTLATSNPLVFRTGRLVSRYAGPVAPPGVFTVGSFGFAFADKGFERLVLQVQAELDVAVIRLHLPASAFMDPSGAKTAESVRRWRSLITKPGIDLRVSHEFLSAAKLQEFLAANTINAFFYDRDKRRGISSVIDHALAVDRPVAITRSGMFRHVTSARPSICIEDSDLRTIAGNGTAPLAPFRTAWTADNLLLDYERMLDSVLAGDAAPVPGAPPVSRSGR